MLNSGLKVFGLGALVLGSLMGAFLGNSQQTLADPEHYYSCPPTVSACYTSVVSPGGAGTGLVGGGAGVMSVNAIRMQL
mgnify:CR=1 FL=1